MRIAVTYLKVLAAQIDNGNIDVALGEHYLKVGEWGRARLALEAAISKGKLRETARAHHLLGETFFKLGVQSTRSA